MDPKINEELIKHREIRFCTERAKAQADARNANDAIQLLRGVKGIQDLNVVNDHCIQVAYDLSQISMRVIEEALQEIGFVLDGSWVCRMRRAIYYYTEETQLVNLGYSHHQSKSTTEIFIKQYEQREHGCRDERPPYYHHYN